MNARILLLTGVIAILFMFSPWTGRADDVGVVRAAKLPFQIRLQRAEAGAAGVLFHQPIDMVQASLALIAFEHAADFFQFADQVGAAELDLLARPAWAWRICVNRH